MELVNDVCPSCKQEVYHHHLNVSEKEDEVDSFDELNKQETDTWEEEELNNLSLEEIISQRFSCSKCKHTECNVNEVAMTGTGFSKLFDIQHHHYLFVSCRQCGFVEVFDPDVLRGHKTGKLGSVLDTLFGG
ncbi:zinc ribbon domain-containing protein [Paenibacillus roseipurpureus]|uniref:Zinc ribbon domain-containing protein n=1 Tax=Paenibacillus roseopurpureus TaxID=2918901 RepID=A0AA96RKI5_9BACL|nr:zinc ribbon domain-containing protein [Paenibacillus sp. MBLB1832]WNR42112.1 zinc ribbon domain-containing protein [Paenibacillus sp. MBLB1832]